ncbi:lipopolysaccharide kinase InaA family protein [Flavobacterium urocaniciphilum]|uniref:Lipopolysaccharide kinase (Kdo/WaaP) family protein n=1 Tax=Flavobacterium urocaniciphilum TaxID=1299341 RepID=A0A1H8YXB0_9FLAO|nr:lipopolysaccharide kinase InaA family protein [Flavobacterium urocaniciphilum]SEP56814.1 Lipopolysaccharide kinase (Kdo/WaaP) family protein [Flavobacterium urocaniciphilum]
MLKINPKFNNLQTEITKSIENYDTSGELLVAGKRNSIKLFSTGEITLNIKSFKKPHFLNQIIYGYIRKSKARRSFEYASILAEKQIGTPTPIAYSENKNWLGLKDSYYVCEHINNVFEFKEVVNNEDLDNRIEILRQFTRFSAYMHQEGVEFLDHSPGNTLIQNNSNGNYSFFLVDLNRMKFHDTMSFEVRMKNLSRLTPKKDMIAIMSNEYAKITGENEDLVFETMWKFTSEFQYRFFRKKRLKKKFLFWKK